MTPSDELWMLSEKWRKRVTQLEETGNYTAAMVYGICAREVEDLASELEAKQSAE